MEVRVAVPPEFDVVIIGGGVVGCSLARALASRVRNLSIALIEKEPRVAAHTSGRNSGVIHSGFHLKPGSLRAKLCVGGARRLKQYCRERGLPLLEGGSLVVATSERELETLRLLERRGNANSVPVRWVEAGEIRKIEPYARGYAALHAPEDAILDPWAYTATLAREAEALGVNLLLGCRVTGIGGEGPLVISTNRFTVKARFLLNCAGGHALSIAQQLGLAYDYTVIPFRGEYYTISREYGHLLKSAIYPTPDLRFPFLGVHLTKRPDGTILVGPNAVPAFGLENYGWAQVRPGQVVSLLASRAAARLLAQGSSFTFMLREILGSLSKELTFSRARRLIPYLRGEMASRGFSGVRPQLVDRWGRLVDDLVLAWTGNSLHILNAISPALTASLELADYIVDLLLEEGLVGGA